MLASLNKFIKMGEYAHWVVMIVSGSCIFTNNDTKLAKGREILLKFKDIWWSFQIFIFYLICLNKKPTVHPFLPPLNPCLWQRQSVLSIYELGFYLFKKIFFRFHI